MDNFFIEAAQAFWQIISLILRALSPLFTGLVLAYLLNRPSEWVRTRLFKARDDMVSSESPKGRVPSMIITYSAVLIILFLIVYAFVILMIGSLPSGGIEKTAAQVYDYLNSSFADISGFLEKFVPFEISGTADTKGILSQWLGKSFSVSGLIKTAAGFAGGLVSFFIGLVASIYLLKDKEYFLSLWHKLLSIFLSQRAHGIVSEVLSEINNVLTTFIKGALIDSMIVALLSSAVLSVLRVRFAVMIGIIGGLLNVIPYFGPFFGMIPAFAAAFASGGLPQAILAVLALIGVQQLDSNFIYPKVVGSSIGLHPLFVLLSVSLFGYFGGIAGMLLAVPTAGIAQVIIRKWAYSR